MASIIHPKLHTKLCQRETTHTNFSFRHFTKGVHCFLVLPVVSYSPPLCLSPCSSFQLHLPLLMLHIRQLFSPSITSFPCFLSICRKLRGLVQNLFMSLFTAAQQNALLCRVLKRSITSPLALKFLPLPEAVR